MLQCENGGFTEKVVFKLYFVTYLEGDTQEWEKNVSCRTNKNMKRQNLANNQFCNDSRFLLQI